MIGHFFNLVSIALMLQDHFKPPLSRNQRMELKKLDSFRYLRELLFALTGTSLKSIELHTRQSQRPLVFQLQGMKRAKFIN